MQHGPRVAAGSMTRRSLPALLRGRAGPTLALLLLVGALASCSSDGPGESSASVPRAGAEGQLDEKLIELQAMFVAAGRDPHPHIEALLDPGLRHDAATLNYLDATASGTLRDQEFSAGNGDRPPPAGFADFNARYQHLLTEVRALADELRLPAMGWEQTT